MSVTKTITTIFLVPTLEIPKDALLDNGFINAYTKDSMQESLFPDAIFLLFKPEDLNKFREFLLSEYERTDNVLDDYDYEGGYVVIVYKLNSNIKKDVTLIKQGKYSKTSKEFQKLFPTNVSIKKGGITKLEISLQVRVFKKSNDLREYWENKIGTSLNDAQEVWEAYDEEKEILNPLNIKL